MRTIANIFIHAYGTLLHKFHVAKFMLWFAIRLTWRAVFHDVSKFSPGEIAGFVKVIHKLKKCTYGSEEYKKMCEAIKPSLDLHYKRNPHHPEYYADGINDMELIDIVELLCDWRAAVLRHEDGDINKSIETNEKRFKISPQLTSIFKNSIK